MRFDAHWLAARGEGASSTCRTRPGGPAPGRRGTSRGAQAPTAARLCTGCCERLILKTSWDAMRRDLSEEFDHQPRDSCRLTDFRGKMARKAEVKTPAFASVFEHEPTTQVCATVPSSPELTP